jgi:hypothetical protein
MINEKTIRTIFLLMLFFALVIWEFIGYKLQGNNLPVASIGRYLASVVLILVSLNWRLVIFLFGFPIIKGNYVGISKEIKQDGTKDNQIEEITIKQSLLSTTISSVSKTSTGEFYSTWRGTLIEHTDKHFKFIIDIDTREQIYNGILWLRFENGKGFGYCTYLEPNTISSKDSVEIELVKPETWWESVINKIW